MIFCIIELHLSLLLTCLSNRSWSKTNKTMQDTCPHILTRWWFFATQFKHMPIKLLVEPPRWTIFVKFREGKTPNDSNPPGRWHKKKIRASVFRNMTSHWQILILLLLFQSQALSNPPNQKRTNFLDHPTKLPTLKALTRGLNSVTYLPQAPFRLTLPETETVRPENGCLEDDSFPFKHGELLVLGRVVYKKRQFSRRFRFQRLLPWASKCRWLQSKTTCFS